MPGKLVAFAKKHNSKTNILAKYRKMFRMYSLGVKELRNELKVMESCMSDEQIMNMSMNMKFDPIQKLKELEQSL